MQHPLPTRQADGNRGSRANRATWDLDSAKPGDLVTVKTMSGSTWNFVLLTLDARGSRNTSAFRGVSVQTNSRTWKEGGVLPSQLSIQRLFQLGEPIRLGVEFGSHTGPIMQVFHNRCLVLGDML